MTDTRPAAFNEQVNHGELQSLNQEYFELVALLDRNEAMRTALGLLAAEGDEVAWIAEPLAGDGLLLRHVNGVRTAALRGLLVPPGLGLTGRVHNLCRPLWVDDYFRSRTITHTFDHQIQEEGLYRLLAVPIVRNGTSLGVLAIGARDADPFGDRAVQRAVGIAQHLVLAVAIADKARLAREVAVHEERRRIAAELHDSVGALLFAIGSGVVELTQTAGDGDPELTARYDRLRTQATDATTALRESLRALRASPSALALAVNLRADCAAFADRTGVPAELMLLDDDPPALSPSRTEVLLGAVREALLNIEKHARASAVAVTISKSTIKGRDALTVAVIDDGVGLRPDHTPGLGLTYTAEAIGRLGGILRVSTDPAGGTLWRVGLPC